MTLDCSMRRKILKGMCSVMAAGALPQNAFASQVHKGSRALSLYNRHTNERHKADFWIAGNYQLDTLNHFDQILRDHRQNIAAPMDKKLFELLFQLQEKLENTSEIHIISGFRSPKTNAMLSANTNGVAKKSYHMKGMAMDIAIPGVDLKDLRNAARSLKVGGVGFYPKSGFIHIDTGRVRSW
ncbi:DUF882 domain-containing protein [Pseudoalteromonas denitrificans]|uniref:Murein endopeptidase K n=1 Tax=Pseudoalteromonas denitrificans DSM 6059 TaxID=1123010 RepID=A0A1I1RX41_9GAMM|nr:DUF882 domain-containing protein [Pseudoalteromonas denitrificans]SFD38821.1 Uncharacterized conserved protein YcbK, DUF882 family [Pseudoalteromonas denitrificans DSM 6059]